MTAEKKLKEIERENFELQYPILIDGAPVSVLRMRRPKARDMKKMQKHKGSEFDRMLVLTGDLADVSPKDLEEMDGEDFTNLSEKVGEMLGVTTET